MSRLSEPLDTALVWVWALGTAAGLGTLAHLTQSDPSDPQSARSLSVPDAASQADR